VYGTDVSVFLMFYKSIKTCFNVFFLILKMFLCFFKCLVLVVANT